MHVPPTSIWHCTIPFALVGNNRRISAGSRWYLTDKYRACKDQLSLLFLSSRPHSPFESCSVRIQIAKKQWKGDIDAPIKVILDSLEHAGVIFNDKLVRALSVEWAGTTEVVVQA